MLAFGALEYQAHEHMEVLFKQNRLETWFAKLLFLLRNVDMKYLPALKDYFNMLGSLGY